MGKRKGTDSKAQALRQRGSFNRRSQRVKDPLFLSGGFFDARDLIQVKYEMVRRVRVEKLAISRAAATFGFSRPAYYQTQGALDRDGLTGLLPRKRGPRHGHKLTDEVVRFLREALSRDSSLRAAELCAMVAQKFGISVHPRSLERVLALREKKRRRRPRRRSSEGKTR